MTPPRRPAAELAALYHERWELEGALDELKTHQRGPRAVLRSKTPEGVEQEIYAHLLVHYAIRALMHQAALDADTRSGPVELHPFAADRAPPAHRPGGLFP